MDFEGVFSADDWTPARARAAFAWKRCPDGGLCILRVDAKAFLAEAAQGTDEGTADSHGLLPCAAFPERVGGAPITEIAPFVFGPAPRDPQTVRGVGKLVLPARLVRLGDHALSGLPLAQLLIPATVERIGRLGLTPAPGPARGDEPRCSVGVAPGCAAYASDGGSLYLCEAGIPCTLLFASRPYAADFSCAPTVRSLGPEAFSYGSSLPQMLRLPANVERIESAPNRSCLWMCEPESVTWRTVRSRGLLAASERVRACGPLVHDPLPGGGTRLVRCKGTALHLDLPARLDGLPLREVGPGAIPNEVRSLSFPSSVERIDGACEAPDLRRLTLPESLRVVGPRLFSEARRRRRAVLPAGCARVGKGSFRGFDLAFEGCGARVFIGSDAAAACFGAGSPPFDFERYDEAILADPIDHEGIYGGAGCYAARAARRSEERGRLLSMLLRVAFPFCLSTPVAARYRRHLETRLGEVAALLLEERDQAVVAALAAEGFFRPAVRAHCLEAFRRARYAPGVAQLVAGDGGQGKPSERVRFAL